MHQNLEEITKEAPMTWKDRLRQEKKTLDNKIVSVEFLASNQLEELPIRAN